MKYVNFEYSSSDNDIYTDQRKPRQTLDIIFISDEKLDDKSESIEDNVKEFYVLVIETRTYTRHLLYTIDRDAALETLMKYDNVSVRSSEGDLIEEKYIIRCYARHGGPLGWNEIHNQRRPMMDSVPQYTSKELKEALKTHAKYLESKSV